MAAGLLTGLRLTGAHRIVDQRFAERQRRFAGPGHARDHRQLFVGDGKRNVLEIVDPRTLDPDKVFHWNFHYTIAVRHAREAYLPR